MAEKTYEVKEKSEEAPAIDPALIEQQAAKQAEVIAAQKVEALKAELAESLSGKSSRYGKSGPESWDKLHDDITNDAVSVAEKRILEKIEAKEKQKEEKEKLTAKQQEDANKAEWSRITNEWAEAVQDGLLPDIKPEVKAKLKSGVVYADLTEEEQNDPGLKSYNEARSLYVKMRSEGKSNSFYRTIQKFYNKQPAGARAPVFGGGVGVTPQSSEPSYDEVAANRRKRFGF